MSTITSRYFKALVAPGSPVKAAVDAALQAKRGMSKRRSEILAQFGTEMYWGTETRLVGALVPVDGALAEASIARPAGTRIEDIHYNGDQRYALIVPDKRSKHGKDLAKQIAEFNSSAVSPSEQICRDLGLLVHKIGSHRTSPSGMAMYHSVCGLFGDVLVFNIPFGGDSGADQDVQIPDWLVEIKRSEFIAISEEGR